MRWDPFRELDRLTSQALPLARHPAVPMDAYRHGDRFFVHFDLPGVDPNTVELTIEKNVLTVKAERGWQRSDGDEVLVLERPQGTFTRQLFLGDTLDTASIEARCENGVLTLTIPVAEAAKPRKVDIVTGDSGPKAVEATAHAA